MREAAKTASSIGRLFHVISATRHKSRGGGPGARTCTLTSPLLLSSTKKMTAIKHTKVQDSGSEDELDLLSSTSHTLVASGPQTPRSSSRDTMTPRPSKRVLRPEIIDVDSLEEFQTKKASTKRKWTSPAAVQVTEGPTGKKARVENKKQVCPTRYGSYIPSERCCL